MASYLLINNFIWPAISYIIAIIGIVTATIVFGIETPILHSQSTRGVIVRFVMIFFTGIGTISIIINRAFIDTKKDSIYNYMALIAGALAILAIAVFIIIGIIYLSPKIALWIRWNDANCLHFYVSNKKDLTELRKRYNYLETHIGQTFIPGTQFRPLCYTDRNYSTEEMMQLLTEFHAPLENATSVNDFYHLALNDENIGNKGIETIVDIYTMAGIPIKKRIFRGNSQNDILSALLYSQQ